MTSETPSPAPRWFFWVSIAAVLWNLMGLMQFAVQMSMDAEALATLPQLQAEVLKSRPAWATIAFAVAVICGTAGSILLALSRKQAVPVLWASLIGVVVQVTEALFLNRGLEAFGSGGLVLTGAISGAAIALVLLSGRASRNGWLTGRR